jgi:integrase
MNESITPELRLEIRKNSKFIQVVLKGSDKKWHRLSSKTKNREEAIEFGRSKLAEWRILESHGIPVGGKTFSYVAQMYLKQLSVDDEAGLSKKSDAQYSAIIKTWYIPYFGDLKVSDIDEERIEGFDRYRKAKMGREPAKSTINKHNIALNRLFEFAVKRKWLTRVDLPILTIKNKGLPSERRGFFEPDEWNRLIKFLANWEMAGRKEITKYKRSVLFEYVKFITMTGLRPGNEALGVRWSDFQYIAPTMGMPHYYKVYLRHGKKSGRGKKQAVEKSHRLAVVDFEMVESLETLKYMRINKVTDDDFVFCMPDGSPISGFSEMFQKALEETGLLFSASGDKRSLYSLRHTYATWNVRKGVTYEKLKTQLGTSVVMLQKHYDHATADTWADHLLLGQGSKAP